MGDAVLADILHVAATVVESQSARKNDSSFSEEPLDLVLARPVAELSLKHPERPEYAENLTTSVAECYDVLHSTAPTTIVIFYVVFIIYVLQCIGYG